MEDINIFPRYVHNKIKSCISLFDYQKELDKLQKEFEKNGIHTFSKKYQGHKIPMITQPHLDAINIAFKWNPNQISADSCGPCMKFEQNFIDEMCQMVGYDTNCWGYICSGGTIANLQALWIARNKMISGHNNKVVLGTKNVHSSINKICNILNVKFVEIDIDTINSVNDIIDVDMSSIMCVVATIGSTEMGLVDDLRKILDVFKGFYIHADAAWGGYFLYGSKNIIGDELYSQLKLIKYADSISIDQHKLGYSPYGAGVFLMNNKHNLKYIYSEFNHISNKDKNSSNTIEGSRSASITTSVWFAHQILKPIYPKIINNIIEGMKLLKLRLQKIDYIQLYDNTNLGTVLFKFKKDKIMNYMIDKFTNTNNINNNKTQLVVTQISGTIYFRIIIIDPNFIDYCDEFVNELQKDYNEYIQIYYYMKI